MVDHHVLNYILSSFSNISCTWHKFLNAHSISIPFTKSNTSSYPSTICMFTGPLLYLYQNLQVDIDSIFVAWHIIQKCTIYNLTRYTSNIIISYGVIHILLISRLQQWASILIILESLFNFSLYN